MSAANSIEKLTVAAVYHFTPKLMSGADVVDQGTRLMVGAFLITVLDVVLCICMHALSKTERNDTRSESQADIESTGQGCQGQGCQTEIDAASDVIPVSKDSFCQRQWKK